MYVIKKNKYLRIRNALFTLSVLSSLITSLLCSQGFLYHDVTSKLPGITNNSWVLGTAWADYDRDGLLDVYIISGYYTQYLFKQTPSGNFTNTATGNLGNNSMLRCPTWGDYDADGYPDLFIQSRPEAVIVAGHSPSVLFKNQGNGTLKKIEGPWVQINNGETAHWADVDGDGDLDLFAFYGKYGTTTSDGIFLYRNDGSHFTDISAQTGLYFERNIEGAQVCDVNGDGSVDLIIDGLIFLGNGDGTFVRDENSGVALEDDEGMAFADLNNDGKFDLIVNANIAPGVYPATLKTKIYRNMGGTFVDITSSLGIPDSLLYHHVGVGTFDFNNDGLMDFYIGGEGDQGIWTIFRNLGNWQFAEVTDSLGLPFEYYRSQSSIADFDRDGDVDILISSQNPGISGKLYQNQLNNDQYLPLKVTDQAGNEVSYGATVRIFPTGTTDDTLAIRFVGDGEGYSSHDMYDLYFGLNPLLSYDIEVVYPSVFGKLVKVDKSVNSSLGSLIPNLLGSTYNDRLIEIRRDGFVKTGSIIHTPDFQKIPTITSNWRSIANPQNAGLKMDWSAITPPGYNYQVSFDTISHFSSPVAFINGIQNDSVFIQGLSEGQTYYWRVRGTFPGDTLPWSDIGRFRVNSLPEFLTTPDTVASEEKLYTHQIRATDQDSALFGDTLHYQLLVKPSWLNIDPTNGIIFGIPYAQNVGDTILTVRVHDGLGGADTATFTVTVTHTNHVPMFAGWNPDTAIAEDDLYTQFINASDQDSALFGDYVRFRLINKPSWLNIDSITGVITGTPRVENLFDTVVTVQAYDNAGGTVTQAYTLHIQHVNHIPEIVSTGSFTAKEDSLYRYQVKVEDPDTLVGDLLSYSLTKKPSWLSVNNTGLITGIPLGKNVGDTLVTVRVSDGKGGIASQSYPITVSHTNHAPVILTQADTTAIEDSVYTYTVRATDQDSALFGDQVRYGFSIKPSWLTMDSITGIISGIPSGKNAQDTVVAIRAFDGKTGQSTQTYTLRVQHINHEPLFVSVPVIHAAEDSLYQYTVTATDADQQFFGDLLKYSFQVKPLWMNIDSVTGIITGIPLGKNVGDTVVTVRVSDGEGGIASQSFPITVSHTNHAPVILTEADTTAIEDSIYTYTVRATDQDSALFGDQVRYRFSVRPSWLTIDSTSGLISGTPSQLNARDTVVTIQAYDGKGGISTQQYSLLVQHVNHAPVFVSIPDTTAKEDSMYTYSVKVTDQDSILFGDKVYFALNNAPLFLSIDSVTGTVSGIPTLVDTVFALIKPKAHLPSIRLKGPRVIITKRNESVEAMPLKKIKPAGKFKIAQPASESAGTDDVIRTFALTIKAYDDKGGVSLQAFDLHVEHTNHPPVFTTLPVSVATEDSFYSYHVSGFDVDTKEFGDSVVIQPVIIPSWMHFDPVSNVLSGTPQGKYAVDTTVRLQMEDQKGKSALQEFQLDMINTNHPPAIVSKADSSVAEDSFYVYALTVIDSDVEYGRDSLIVEILSLPSWLTFTDDTVRGIPLYYNVGDTLVSLRVIDAKGSMDSMQWVITVTPTYHLPENFGLSSTIPKDTLNIDRSKDLVFTWNPSHDADVEDTLFYSFHIWGNSLDTTILNLKDTSLSTQLMKYFTVSTPYRWTVGVTDKRFIVPSHDTIMFVTSDKILNVDDWKSKIPTDFIVYQNYPNPFNPSTTIRFGVPVTSEVLIEIYNIIGQRVTTLTNQEFDARYYEVRWNAATVSSGVYFAVVRMKPLNEPSGSRHFIKKLLMLK